MSKKNCYLLLMVKQYPFQNMSNYGNFMPCIFLSKTWYFVQYYRIIKECISKTILLHEEWLSEAYDNIQNITTRFLSLRPPDLRTNQSWRILKFWSKNISYSYTKTSIPYGHANTVLPENNSKTAHSAHAHGDWYSATDHVGVTATISQVQLGH